MAGKKGMHQARRAAVLEPGMLHVADVVARLGISRNTVYRAIAAGEIPSTRVGKRILVPASWMRETLNPKQ